MQLSKNPLVNILFFLALLGGIAAFVYLWYASEKSAEVQEPSLLAYSKVHGVILNIQETLYHTDVDGRFIASYSFESLGLEQTVGDIVIIEDALLVTQGRSHSVSKCTFPLTSCEEIAEVKGLPGVEALDIAVPPDKQHFYITSSGAHKIDYYAIDGHHVYALSLDERLNYPNGIVALGDGKIVVADTNNHRIIGIKHDDVNARVVWELPVESTLTREGFTWPTTLAVDHDGFLWVVNLDGFFEEGDVIIYERIPDTFEASASGMQTRTPTLINENVTRFALPEHTRPRKLQTTEKGMLISDGQSFEVIETDLSGLSYREFGDITVQNAFETLRLEKVYWDDQIWIAQMLIGLLLLMLIAAGIIEYITAENKEALFSKSKTYEESEGEFSREQIITPDYHEIIWLHVKPEIIKKFKVFAGILAFASVGLLSMFIYLGINDATALGALAVLLMIMVATIFLGLKTVSNQRIGVKGRRIYIVDVFGKSVDDDANNVTYTRQRVLVKGRAISVHDGYGKALFDEAQFAHYILPLLTEKNNANEFQVFFEKLKQRDLKTWAGMIASIVIFAVILWYEFYGIKF